MRLVTALSIGLSLLIAQGISYAENLEQIYQLAVENDPIMRAAEASYRSQKEAKKQALGDLLPQVGAEVSYTDLDNQFINPNAAAAEALAANKTTSTGWTVSIRQQLINLTNWYTFRSSKRVTESAEIEFLSNQQALILRTIEAYLNILKAQDNLTSSLAEETAIKQQLDQTQQRFDVGLVAITEVHESQAAYDLAKVSRLTNQGALEVAYESMSLLTGQPHSLIQTLSPALPITSPEPDSKEQWEALAQQGNFELQKAEKAKEAAEFAAKAVKAGHYPTLSASFTHSENDIDGERYTIEVDGAEEETDLFKISLLIPLYSGGKISSARRQAYADLDKANETLAGAKRRVTQQIRALHIAAMTQIQQVAARKQSITSTKSALEAIQAGYNVGTRNIVDVLTAQKNLFAAERDYANARYDYILRMIELKKAAGLLTPDDISNLNQWIAPESATKAQAGLF